MLSLRSVPLSMQTAHSVIPQDTRAPREKRLGSLVVSLMHSPLAGLTESGHTHTTGEVQGESLSSKGKILQAERS